MSPIDEIEADLLRTSPAALAALLTAVRAVRARHIEGAGNCSCGTRCVECGNRWPCSTIREIDAGLTPKAEDL